MHYGPFYGKPRITIDIEDSDEAWETVYETIRREAEPKPAPTDERGVQIGKRIPAKGTE